MNYAEFLPSYFRQAVKNLAALDRPNGGRGEQGFLDLVDAEEALS